MFHRTAALTAAIVALSAVGGTSVALAGGYAAAGPCAEAEAEAPPQTRLERVERRLERRQLEWQLERVGFFHATEPRNDDES